MQLHKLRRGAKFIIVPEDDGSEPRLPPDHRKLATNEIFVFSHIDGMYSLCYDHEGGIVHIVAWQEVEEVTQ